MNETIMYSNKIINYSREDLLAKVAAKMSDKRFKHVLGVEQAAISLAEQYNADVEKASIAALTHDYAKERPDGEMRKLIEKQNFDKILLVYGNAIWHGPVGAYLVEKELQIHDEEILNAIRRHTVGAKHMTLLDKIIYVADYIEAGRDFPGVAEAREIAAQDLDAAVAFETKGTLQHLISQNKAVFPATIATYNVWVAGQK